MLWMALFGCTGAPPAPAETVQVPADWGAARASEAGTYRVALRTDPADPEVGALFVMEATVTDGSGAPVEHATVVLDARMPQHDHGMMTDPKEDAGQCDDGGCRHPGGVYRSSGFKFHMNGDWTVTAEIDGPSGRDTASFVYAM